MKVDIYNTENNWKNWKEEYKSKNIEDIEKANSDFIKQYLFDMELGQNVSMQNKKGARSFSRLMVLRNRLVFLTKTFEERFNNTKLTELTAEQVAQVFNDMRHGTIKKQNGEAFQSTADYVKSFKALWNWHIRRSRRQKKPKIIPNICEDLDTRYDNKPVWVYLNEKDFDKLLEKCDNYYKPLLSFFFDTGCRVSEGINVLVEDITEKNGEVIANLREENSKTFGRKIKLMLCGKEILDYIKENKLKPGDRLFSHSVFMTNDYLKELAKKVFGDKKSEGGEYFSKMTLYDLRHCSCCFWLDRYKRSSDLMYRFGWKTEKYIHYYSEFKGKRDNINQDDMFIDITKTEMEKEINRMRLEFQKKLDTLSKEVIELRNEEAKKVKGH